MRLAAADAARGKGSPPRELILGMQCQSWHTLPRAGGLLDQPARLMLAMTVSVNVYRAVKAWSDSQNWAKFARQSPDQFEIVEEVLRLEQWRTIAGQLTGWMRDEPPGSD